MAMKSVINGWDRHHREKQDVHTNSQQNTWREEISQKTFAQTEGYIKMDTEERGCEGGKWTHLPHARNQWDGLLWTRK